MSIIERLKRLMGLQGRPVADKEEWLRAAWTELMLHGPMSVIIDFHTGITEDRAWLQIRTLDGDIKTFTADLKVRPDRFIHEEVIAWLLPKI